MLKMVKYQAYIAHLPVGCCMHNCFGKLQNYPFNWKIIYAPMLVSKC